MRFFFEIHLALTYLRSERRTQRGLSSGFISFIAVFSVLGIALGVAALVVVPAVMNGFQKEVRKAMQAVVPHIQVLQAQGQALQDVNSLQARLQAMSQVRSSQVVASAPAVVLAGDNLRGVQVLGLDWAQSAPVTRLGERLNAQAQAALLTPPAPDSVTQEAQAVLGVELARTLGVKVGDKLRFFSANSSVGANALPMAKVLRVAGTVQTGYYGDDASLVLMPYEQALTYLHLSGPNGIQIALKHAETAPQLAQSLLHQWWQEGEQGLRVLDWTQNNRAWFDAIPLQKRLVAIILAAIVAVAAFNLISTLVMVVSDKRREIAILRTLGSSPSSIMAIFMLQGSFLGFMGAGLGLLFGLTLASNVDVVVATIEMLLGVQFLNKSVYFLDYVPSDVRAGDVVWVLLLSLILAFLATIYPSWRAARLQPARVLSHA